MKDKNRDSGEDILTTITVDMMDPYMSLLKLSASPYCHRGYCVVTAQASAARGVTKPG